MRLIGTNEAVAVHGRRFTGQRHGVYLKAGFMMGLGRNVFWMCSKDEM